MKIHFNYNPIYKQNVNAGLLVINVVIGLLLVILTGQVRWLILLAILSQYSQIKILFLKIFYPIQIKGLDNVITSAKLFDKPDNYTYRRFLRVVSFEYFENSKVIKIKVLGNGISNLEKLDKLSLYFSNAFGYRCYVLKINLDSVVYVLQKEVKDKEIDKNEF